MTPWQLLDSAPIPGSGGEMRLYRRGSECSITLTGGGELMNSRVHGSEEALAELACRPLAGRPAPRVLIGGLGMGFTLAAALRHLGADARVVVAELVPAVVEWNRVHLGEYAGHPLRDPRAAVVVGDVGELLRKERQAFDAIMLDVDNGPEGLTRRENDWLYSTTGLGAIHDALRPQGLLAVWSAGPDRGFSDRLRRIGFVTEEVSVRAHASGKGARHTIWIAAR
jgi:spermidine synthase